jgi:hypothetical protein
MSSALVHLVIVKTRINRGTKKPGLTLEREKVCVEPVDQTAGDLQIPQTLKAQQNGARMAVNH